MNPGAYSGFDHLLREARAKGGTAQGQLLDQYRNYLTLLARVHIGRQIQGKADAADVVQETFLEAHRGFPGFKGHSEGEFVQWLRRILATTLAHLIRRYLGTQARDVRLERQLAEELDESSRVLDRGLAAPEDSPSQQAVVKEQGVLLADAMEQLPQDYREVLTLRHLESLTFPEVARRMNRTVDSVEKLWVRALARLRQVLGDSHESKR
jgi:RNA polymerase sigma-70 factor (ECF subfamily)